jgi:hypothetical protein
VREGEDQEYSGVWQLHTFAKMKAASIFKTVFTNFLQLLGLCKYLVIHTSLNNWLVVTYKQASSLIITIVSTLNL